MLVLLKGYAIYEALYQFSYGSDYNKCW